MSLTVPSNKKDLFSMDQQIFTVITPTDFLLPVFTIKFWPFRDRSVASACVSPAVGRRHQQK